MKKGKYSNGRARKPVALVLALVLVLGIAIGGTIAWLTDTTDDVVNTFTTSNVDIELTETKKDFQMVPGCTIEKDPIVTVQKGSEDAWVFIEVKEEGGNVTVDGKTYSFTDFITYAIDKNWTKLEGVTGVNNVYYAKYDNRDDVDISIKVLGYNDNEGNFVNNKVLVEDTVTKEMMDALTEETYPKLTFTAYACQYMKDNTTPFTPAEAWDNVKP